MFNKYRNTAEFFASSQCWATV